MTGQPQRDAERAEDEAYELDELRALVPQLEERASVLYVVTFAPSTSDNPLTTGDTATADALLAIGWTLVLDDTDTGHMLYARAGWPAHVWAELRPVDGLNPELVGVTL